MLLVIGT